ncbi:hypothetical protein Pla123a_23780 [Posidoniimonas polymericola]|uniref:Glycoside-hydrolase family GH114 TIM-barrel domain-containing protein n=1 Tax=Posidoniimonas polymericola TaxID=2528002 RepID=A0A5C5YQ07_9BACT|nr:endo alpha-1,4 polygalactosaminidase [Posidoniimonas polymericola]TWT76953.1 hypothetical protein Pla123a_23780 [Posidoniimonas polymericola]
MKLSGRSDSTPRFLARLGLLVAAFSAPAAADGATAATSDGPVLVRDWGYQLQGGPGEEGLQPAGLAAAPHDLIVMDFSAYGDEGSKFTAQQIADVKHSVGGDGSRRAAVAYVSIGEASEFRSYWDAGWTASGAADSPLTAAAPNWLGPTNPDWPESRKVRYWDPAWQTAIFNEGGTGWLDQVVSQGFDGAYLDIVDAYYFWGNEAQPADARPGDPLNGQAAARRMAEFVVAMTAHARQTNPQFFVIPQNGEFILSDLANGPSPQPADGQLRADYLDAMFAIGIEDIYYRGDADVNNPLNVDADKVQVLKDDFLAAGKAVLVVDYLSTPGSVASFESLARSDQFVPYAAPTRDLDRLGPPAPSLAADFNQDGVIDAQDLAVWAASYAATAGLDADANHDGRIDAADYTAWRDAAAALNPALTSTPEPSGTAILVVLLALWPRQKLRRIALTLCQKSTCRRRPTAGWDSSRAARNGRRRLPYEGAVVVSGGSDS